MSFKQNQLLQNNLSYTFECFLYYLDIFIVLLIDALHFTPLWNLIQVSGHISKLSGFFFIYKDVLSE